MVKAFMAWLAVASLLPCAAQSAAFARAQFLVSLTLVPGCNAAAVRDGARVLCTPGVAYRVIAAGDPDPSSISRDGDLVTIFY
jgi:hypothetical protein